VTYPSRRAPTTEPDWLTLGQAAKFLGVAQSTIRKWSDQGRVPAFYTPGGHRRYRRRDLEALLDRSGPGGSTAGPLVLVVDDDARIREYVRVNLEMEGYTVREAASKPIGVIEGYAACFHREGDESTEYSLFRDGDYEVKECIAPGCFSRNEKRSNSRADSAMGTPSFCTKRADGCSASAESTVIAAVNCESKRAILRR